MNRLKGDPTAAFCASQPLHHVLQNMGFKVQKEHCGYTERV